MKIIDNIEVYSKDQIVQIECSDINVIIGPNNSGKSLLLSELLTRSINGSRQYKVLNTINRNKASVLNAIKNTISFQPTQDQDRFLVLIGGKSIGSCTTEERKGYENRLTLDSASLSQIVSLLTGQQRLSHTDRTHFTKDSSEFNCLIHKMAHDEILFNQVDDAFRRLIHKRIILDLSKMIEILVRTSNDFSYNLPFDYNPRSKSIIEWLESQQCLSIHSDGIRACWGIINTLFDPHQKLIFIDEPEAFLHPSLAYRLGSLIASESKKQGKQFFIATHSSHFLQGILDTAQEVSILRTSFSHEHGEIFHLPPTTARSFLKDPLISSINASESLFYDLVILVEGPSDRGFYQFMITALNLIHRDSSIKIIETHGKHSCKKLARQIRKAGIPVKCIFDIDFLKSSDRKELLESIGCDGTVANARSHLCATANENLKKAYPEFYSTNGIHKNYKLLKSIPSVDTAINDLKGNGVYLVPVSSLEHWVPGLTADKGKWFEAFIDYYDSLELEEFLNEEWVDDLRIFLADVLN